MAAAEARAAWQRTANRCFVQEDAKRAPKLACCPSTSSASKQVDAGPANATDGDGNISVGFVPLYRNSSYSNLPPESRWWLQLQPNYGYQKALTNEQLKTMETEMETCGTDVQNSTSKASEVYLQNKDNGMHMEDSLNDKPCFETYLKNSAVFIKKDPEIRKQELKTVYSKSSQEPLKHHYLGESCELLEMDPGGCTVSKQPNELSFDLDSHWIDSEKTMPWWRMADRDELASLVAQRSLDLIENCDLPCPQKTDVRMDPYAYLGCFGSDGLLASDDLKAQTRGLPCPIVNVQSNLALRNECRMQSASSEKQLQYGSDMLNSDCSSHNVTTGTQISESDPGRAQLLEALCHSQTRAREAEKAVKRAYVEKEHILKLFFRQASHLFAYKQWFRLLQLENLSIQIKNNNQPISSLFPVVRPWMPHKGRKLQKSWRKPAVRGKRGKRGRPNRDTSKFTVAFALGLTLVGAGLLLGWTVGWMLPTF